MASKKNRKSQGSRSSSGSQNLGKVPSPAAFEQPSVGMAEAVIPAVPRETIGTLGTDRMMPPAPISDHDLLEAQKLQMAEAERVALARAEAERKEAESRAAELRKIEKIQANEAALKEQAATQAAAKKAFEDAERKQKEADRIAKENAEKKVQAPYFENNVVDPVQAEKGEPNGNVDDGTANGAMAAMAAAGAAIANIAVQKGKGEDLDQKDLDKLDKKPEDAALAPILTESDLNPVANEDVIVTAAIIEVNDDSGGKAEEGDNFAEEKSTENEGKESSCVEGYLYKPGKIQTNRWVQRYYILEEDGRLLYKLTRSDESVKGQFKTNQNVKIIEESVPNKEGLNYGYAFVVRLDKRNRMFSAASEDERKQWLAAFKKFE